MRKPSITGLKREVLLLQENFDDARRDVEAHKRDLRKIGSDLEISQVECEASNKQVAWFENEREDLLRYYDEAMRLLKPHLVPISGTNAIVSPDDPLERFLLQVRERITRYYDAMGHNVYRETPYYRRQI